MFKKDKILFFKAEACCKSFVNYIDDTDKSKNNIGDELKQIKYYKFLYILQELTASHLSYNTLHSQRIRCFPRKSSFISCLRQIVRCIFQNNFISYSYSISLIDQNSDASIPVQSYNITSIISGTLCTIVWKQLRFYICPSRASIRAQMY